MKTDYRNIEKGGFSVHKRLRIVLLIKMADTIGEGKGWHWKGPANLPVLVQMVNSLGGDELENFIDRLEKGGRKGLYWNPSDEVVAQIS